MCKSPVMMRHDGLSVFPCGAGQHINKPSTQHDFSAGTIAATTLRDLPDRALVATLAYSFARITPALKMDAKDLRPRGAGWTVRLHKIRRQAPRDRSTLSSAAIPPSVRLLGRALDLR